jgi:hypothetical protein
MVLDGSVQVNSGPETCLTESFHKVVLHKSIHTLIRQLILDYITNIKNKLTDAAEVLLSCWPFMDSRVGPQDGNHLRKDRHRSPVKPLKAAQCSISRPQKSPAVNTGSAASRVRGKSFV